MADNVGYTPGTGATVAADEIGGVLWQRNKITLGADGVNDGDVSSSNPMPVVLTTGAVTIGKVDQGTGGASAWLVTGTGGTFPVTGTFWQATQPVSGTVAATQSGTWNITNISGTISLPTGAATEATLSTLNGKVTACNTGAVVLAAGAAVIGAVTQSGTWNVGTVSTVTSLTQFGGTNIVTGGAAGLLGVGGPNATNVAITGNPVNQGAQAVSSENSAVTAGRMVQLVADLVGKLIVQPFCNPENIVSGCISTAMTGTTSTSLVGAPGGSLRNYITTIVASCAHATQGTDIAIQDGSGGTTLWIVPAAALYGGAVITFSPPLRQPTANTALYAANVTTGSSTKISANGWKGL